MSSDPNLLRLEPPPPLPPKVVLLKRPELESKPSGLIDRWFTHSGHGLSPQRLNQIYQTAEVGHPAEQCDLFDDVIERDGHLRSQVDTRIEAVAGKEWIIQAGGDSDADIQAAKLLEHALRRVPNMRDTIAHVLSSLFYGWAATEIVWDLTPEGPIAPVWFANVEPRRFIFDDFGDPRLVVERDRWNGIALEPGRWMFAARRHRLTVMAGLMRSATWWSLWKSMSVRDWVIYNERYGLPYPVGKYDDSTPIPERDVLRQIVQSIGRDGFGVVHRSCEITSVNVKGTDPTVVHGAMVSLCNQEISKLILGATLTSGEGTSTGSYALGSVHENVAFTRTQGDAAFASEVFEQFVSVPFVVWNGLKAKPPRLKIHIVKELDPKERMDLYCRAVAELGLEIDRDQPMQEFQLKAPSGAADAIPGAPEPEPSPGGDGDDLHVDTDGFVVYSDGELFNPNQPRDKNGRFVGKGGRGGGAVPGKKTIAAKRSTKAAGGGPAAKAKEREKAKATREKARADRAAVRAKAKAVREKAKAERAAARAKAKAGREQKRAAREKAKADREAKKAAKEKAKAEKAASKKPKPKPLPKKVEPEPPAKATGKPGEATPEQKAGMASLTAKMDKGNDEFTPAEETAVRGRLAEVLGSYGMVSRDAADSRFRGYDLGDQASAMHVHTPAIGYPSGTIVYNSKNRAEFSEGVQVLSGKIPAAKASDRAADHATTLLHEEVHGHSPMSAMAYKGHGAKIEEVTTESVAQRVAKDMGIVPTQVAYKGHIAEVREVLHRAYPLPKNMDDWAAHEVRVQGHIENRRDSHASRRGHDDPRAQ